MKKLGSMKLISHHGIRRPKPSEHCVTHNVGNQQQHCNGEDKNEGENLELKDINENYTDKDKDYYFVDTTLIGNLIRVDE